MTSGDGPRGRFSSCCACNWMLAPPSDALRPRGPMPFNSCRVGGCSRDCSWEANTVQLPTEYQILLVPEPRGHRLGYEHERRRAFWASGEMRNYRYLQAEVGQTETLPVEKLCLTLRFPAFCFSYLAGCHLHLQNQAAKSSLFPAHS